jgi:hypothetical protein
MEVWPQADMNGGSVPRPIDDTIGENTLRIP